MAEPNPRTPDRVEGDATQAATRPGTAGAGQVPAEAYVPDSPARRPVGSRPTQRPRPPVPPRYTYDPRWQDAPPAAGGRENGRQTTPTPRPVLPTRPQFTYTPAINPTPLNPMLEKWQLPVPRTKHLTENMVWWSTAVYDNGRSGPLDDGRSATLSGQDEIESVSIATARLWAADERGAKLREKVLGLMDKYYGVNRWERSYMQGLWNKAVTEAANNYTQFGIRVDPIEQFKILAGVDPMSRQFGGGGSDSDGGGGWYSSWGGGGWGGGWGGGGGYGGGGGGGGGGGSIALTNRDTAKRLINETLTAYLGREATNEEFKRFFRTLNDAERANPITVSVDGAGNTVQSGGVDQAQRAIEFAQAKDDFAEFQASTKYLDMFTAALQNDARMI